MENKNDIKILFITCVSALAMALIVSILAFLLFGKSIYQPKQHQAEWIRVDTDFENSNCENFCRSKSKTCSPNECEPDQWCGATGGMMEIETWSQEQGTVCDRKWQGQCQAVIDRYPPVFNFHCCCR